METCRRLLAKNQKVRLNMNPDMDEKRYLTRQETADLFRVKVRTVSRWVREGCPVFFTGSRKGAGKGCRPLFIAGEVEAWLKERTRKEREGDSVSVSAVSGNGAEAFFGRM